jgi:hypothetical protein
LAFLSGRVFVRRWECGLRRHDCPRALGLTRRSVPRHLRSEAVRTQDDGYRADDSRAKKVVDWWGQPFCATLAIWNASSSHKRALGPLEESACDECRYERPADRAVGAECRATWKIDPLTTRGIDPLATSLKRGFYAATQFSSSAVQGSAEGGHARAGRGFSDTSAQRAGLG